MSSFSNGHDDLFSVNFERPPVVEVACAVQFAGPLVDDQSALNGFWPRIREKYPNLVMQPALPPMREDFGPASGVSFQLLGQISPRYWLASADQADLVQIQADRLAFNWRKEPLPGISVGDYPRYPHIRERFREALAELLAEADARGTTAPPNWCEIAYINHIPAMVDGRKLGLASILRLVNDVPLHQLPEPEDSAFLQRYVLTRDGSPYGRLHINASAAFTLPNQELTYVLTFTVRGLVSGEAQEDVLHFMDDGRDLIIHAFQDATHVEMHEEWGLV
jgi:uncharacterized protein (TIGR04255 family)